MDCPNCRSRGFVKTNETPRKTTVYKTDNYATLTKRYRICMVCGYKFKTTEIVDEPKAAV